MYATSRRAALAQFKARWLHTAVAWSDFQGLQDLDGFFAAYTTHKAGKDRYLSYQSHNSAVRHTTRAVAARLAAPQALWGTPYTLDGAMMPTQQARVITSIEYPHEIYYVNPAWEDLCGFTYEEVVGKTLKIIQGPNTDPAALRKIRDATELQTYAQVTLINYRQNGEPFLNCLQVSPLLTLSRVTHMLGIMYDSSRCLHDPKPGQLAANHWREESKLA